MQLHESKEMEKAIKDSLDCYHACTESIGMCLQMGGEHAAPEHIRLMRDCAQICNTSAEFMMRNSEFHGQVCEICADICDRCAESCGKFDDKFMKECAEACRKCAESCRKMAQG
jgi:hypothetical protein